jgi:cell division protein FtsQ
MPAAEPSRIHDPDLPVRERVGGPMHRRLILGAGAVVVAAVLTWLAAFSSVLGVRTVEVHGTSALTAAQVRRAAAIASGTPLLRLNTTAVRHRVRSLPEVASVRVSTSFPSTVVISITERVAVGFVQVGSGFGLVDRTGGRFRTVSTQPARLPLFVVPAGPAGRTTSGAVATVAADLPASVRAKVASIQALDPNAITVLLTDQRVVRWGSADRSADKARILPALLSQPGTQIDLTDPDQPFTH